MTPRQDAAFTVMGMIVAVSMIVSMRVVMPMCVAMVMMRMLRASMVIVPAMVRGFAAVIDLT